MKRYIKSSSDAIPSQYKFFCYFDDYDNSYNLREASEIVEKLGGTVATIRVKLSDDIVRPYEEPYGPETQVFLLPNEDSWYELHDKFRAYGLGIKLYLYERVASYTIQIIKLGL